MRKILVNVAVRGRENYPSGQTRLIKSLANYYKDDRLFYTGTYPPGSPTHEEAPYAFKYHLMQYVIDKGYDLILWVDAAIVFLKNIDPMWDWIEKKGILVVPNPGCPENFFTSKDCLDKLGCSLETAATFSQCMGGIVGYNAHSATAMKIFQKMRELSVDGVSFQGGSNTSPDPKFIAHRHDQSCLSYLSFINNIEKVPDDWVRYTSSVTGNTFFELRGI